MPVSFSNIITIRIITAALAVLTILWANNIRAEEEEKLSYLELGITVGLIVHPGVGYWWGRKGIRLSGMYLNEEHYECHLNFAYALSDSGKVQQSINLLTSRVVGSDPGADYNYTATGVAYSVNYHGFFLEIGLGRPWRDDIGNLADDPLIPVGYWGYLYRFKPNNRG